jgi:hypothetical protein
MKTWTWLLLGFGACGGSDTGGDDDDTTDNGGTDEDEDADDICRDVNEYDVEDLDPCDQTWTALTQLAFEARHCDTASDCWAAAPGCEDWVAAECWIVLNDCVDSQTVREFSDHGHCTGDDNDVCSGCPSAPDVDCVNSICQFVYE